MNLEIDNRLKGLLLYEGYEDRPKEEIDALIEDSDVHGNFITLDGIEYVVMDDTDITAYIDDMIEESIDCLKADTKHSYDWLINCIDKSRLIVNYYDWVDIKDEFDINGITYYYWEI